MNFDVLKVEQRTPEWIAARLGRVTSSRADAMLSKPRTGSGESAGRRNLRVALVLERLTGKPQERAIQSSAMTYGVEHEEAARMAYNAITGDWIETTGFLRHKTLMAGASLDGHLGDFEELIEIKCPYPATHWDYVQTGVIPLDYSRQILHALWLTGAKRCRWMSFCPEFSGRVENLQAKLVTVERNDAEIEDYDKKIRAFLSDVENTVAAALTMADLRGTLEASLA